MTTRRDLTLTVAGLLAGWPGLPEPARAETSDLAQPRPTRDDRTPEHAVPPEWETMRALDQQAAMLLYPGFTALDLVGPQFVFGCTLGLKVHLVARTREPVMSDTGLAIVPTMTLAECPRDLAILFVPGGMEGTLDAIRDGETLSFVADRGSRATWVTSVCTGSLVLGAAGLLRGYRATSHWVARDLLAQVGAEPVDERVVIDRNRATGAGVTAGIDFGLALVARLRGEKYARSIQLLAEYAPEPPFRAGTPVEAGPETTRVLADMFAGFRQKASATLAKLPAR